MSHYPFFLACFLFGMWQPCIGERVTQHENDNTSIGLLVDSLLQDPIQEPTLDIVVDDSMQVQAGYYTQWAKKAHTWLSQAIGRLVAGRQSVIKWMKLQHASGTEIDGITREIYSRLKEMRNGIRSMYIIRGTECDVSKNQNTGRSSGTLAYVYPTQKKGKWWVVHVCDYAGEFKRDTSTMTLIHEMSHHMGTTDYAYGRADCLALKPDQARQNADSYSLLVEELRSNRKSYYEEGTGTKHPMCNLECDSNSWNYDGDGTTYQLDLLPPLKSCLSCSWKLKTTGAAGWYNWATNADFNGAEDTCGDGTDVPTLVTSGDCDTHGCKFIQDTDACLGAANVFAIERGHEFKKVQRKGRTAHSTDRPFGCHMTEDELFLNTNTRSVVNSSKEDSMVCQCPTPEHYGSGHLHDTCCTVYKCTNVGK